MGAACHPDAARQYRARDTKLARHVAIKVLPAAFAGDAERMARFQREAYVAPSGVWLVGTLTALSVAFLYSAYRDLAPEQ